METWDERQIMLSAGLFLQLDGETFRQPGPMEWWLVRDDEGNLTPTLILFSGENCLHPLYTVEDCVQIILKNLREDEVLILGEDATVTEREISSNGDGNIKTALLEIAVRMTELYENL